MFKQSIRAVSSRRLLSVTPRAHNAVSELYIQQIKQFKPTPVNADSEGIKHFQLPSKPSIPSDEVSADAVNAYESSEVETESAPAAGSVPAGEEDWFVFPEEGEHH
ncbi:uncharacterized protein CXQ87_002805 [Candidozyma duobushaemuli]|uniref:Uncharacterized protein n=2 Tax=Candidozyma TaxID=3303203 RepID=A0ABX8I5E0_9ASCO|nr:uncharacterized protein CXQ87_002805 [[Candida] duobushaemulonis]PVH14658.1 hypothetical protein CXQ87_002805 [[Candida] duobushaemulonis]QWU87192.1 hypothetical protein CA3LBN_001457 [[Candida] haemuloni]